MAKMSELSDFEIDYHKELPYWTPMEAAALISGVNPKQLNPHKLPEKVKNIYTALVRAIEKEEKPLSFKKGDNDIMLDPFSFIRWAKWKRRHKIPEYFKYQSVVEIYCDYDLYMSGRMSDKEAEKNTRTSYQWETLVDKEALQKQNNKLPLKGLPSSNTLTIDMDSDKLSKELRICIQAYQHIYEDGWEHTLINTQLSPRQVISIWLKKHYPELLSSEIKRICTVVNIYKKQT